MTLCSNVLNGIIRIAQYYRNYHIGIFCQLCNY